MLNMNHIITINTSLGAYSLCSHGEASVACRGGHHYILPAQSWSKDLTLIRNRK